MIDKTNLDTAYKDALLRIRELEDENALLKEKLAIYENKKPAGRKYHGESWSETYMDFVAKYENGMTISMIVETSSISRRTAYRYKKYYDSLSSKKNSSDR